MRRTNARKPASRAKGDVRDSRWRVPSLLHVKLRQPVNSKVTVASDSVTPGTIPSMEFSRPEYWSGRPFPSPGDLPNPGAEPRSPTLQADSFPAELPGKPKNTRMGSLSLLHQICPTQDSNRGLLHCKRILYQLSYEEIGWGDKLGHWE